MFHETIKPVNATTGFILLTEINDQITFFIVFLLLGIMNKIGSWAQPSLNNVTSSTRVQ